MGKRRKRIKITVYVSNALHPSLHPSLHRLAPPLSLSTWLLGGGGATSTGGVSVAQQPCTGGPWQPCMSYFLGCWGR